MIFIYTKSGNKFKESYGTKEQYLKIQNNLSTTNYVSFDNNRLYSVNNIEKIEFKED